MEKQPKSVGSRRILCALLALFGPMVTYALHPPYGEALYADLLIFASVLFSAGVVFVFCVDLVAVQMLTSKQGVGRLKPNKAVRNFELAAVIVIVAVYGGIWGLDWYSHHPA